jgi:hypothetical protein
LLANQIPKTMSTSWWTIPSWRQIPWRWSLRAKLPKQSQVTTMMTKRGTTLLLTSKHN